MCKHVLNAQVSIRAPCCQKWFDCPECHEDMFGEDHELMKTTEMVFACKKCKKVFRKQIEEFEEADEFCPGCDNHFMPDAKTPESEGHLVIGFESKKGHENKVMIDDREKQRKKVLLEFDEDDVDWDQY
jgi:uncharacterized CHY-type Zn-finger protein